MGNDADIGRSDTNSNVRIKVCVNNITYLPQTKEHITAGIFMIYLPYNGMASRKSSNHEFSLTLKKLKLPQCRPMARW